MVMPSRSIIATDRALSYEVVATIRSSRRALAGPSDQLPDRLGGVAPAAMVRPELVVEPDLRRPSGSFPAVQLRERRQAGHESAGADQSAVGAQRDGSVTVRRLVKRLELDVVVDGPAQPVPSLLHGDRIAGVTEDRLTGVEVVELEAADDETLGDQCRHLHRYSFD